MRAEYRADAGRELAPAVVGEAGPAAGCPGGGIAVMTHGRPLWLGQRDWARALRDYLEDWFGPVRAGCGTDEQTVLARRRLLEATGLVDVAVLEHHFSVPVDADFVSGPVLRSSPRAAVNTAAASIQCKALATVSIVSIGAKHTSGVLATADRRPR